MISCKTSMDCQARERSKTCHICKVTGISVNSLIKPIKRFTENNGFVSATKLGTTNKFFVAATKNFAAATKRFLDKTKHFVVATKFYCYPYFNK